MNEARARPLSSERPFPRVVPRRLAAPGSLAADALAARNGVADLFEHPPGELPGGSLEPPGRPSPLSAAAFTTTSAAATEKLGRILAGEGRLVTTGQQPGLFLGPLYTLYKAVTAVRVARELERTSGVPVLPVFWVASDDHDWQEVARCRILAADETLRTLAIDPPPDLAGRSVGPSPLPPAVTGLLEVLRAESNGVVAGAAPSWVEALGGAYRPGATFSAAFVGTLAAAFDGWDLAMLDSAHPAVRDAAADTVRDVLVRPAIVTDAMRAGREGVEATGHEATLTPPPGGLQVFVDRGNGRQHLLAATDGSFELDEGRIEAAELLGLLDADPSAFSPAAALRPALESRLLPVGATVLGPGEIAYWAQLRPLFRALDVSMPPIVPRDSWVLVEPRIDRLLDRLGLDPATVEAEGTAIDDRWIARSRPPGVARNLAALRAALEDGVTKLDEAVARELPGLKSAAGKAAHRVDQALEELSCTIDARVRERERIALGQAARVRAHLVPGGRPQERVLGAAQFLARHGRGLLDDLLAAGRVAGRGEQD